MPALFLGGGRELHRLVQSLDSCVVHAMCRLRGPTEQSGEVIIVDVDERSLAELGQWPWPRTVLAELVRALNAGGPRVIGLDMVFAEPDRSSPRRYAEAIGEAIGREIALPEGALDNDAALGAALADAPVVLGYIFQFGGAQPHELLPAPRFCVPLRSFGTRASRWSHRPGRASRAVPSTPEIADNALSEGHCHAGVDARGIFRNVPLFVECADTLFPSLAFEVAREGLGCEEPAPVMGEYGMTGVEFGEGRFVPVDTAGNLYLNFRGPPGTFPYVSAVDVLRARAGPDLFSGKLVLVGASAYGLRDLAANPFGGGMPGVEVHATVVDNILRQDPLRYDVTTERGIQLVTLLVGGVLLSAALAYFPPLVGGALAVSLLLLTVLGNYCFLFSRDVLVGVTFPALAFVAVFGVVTFGNYVAWRRRALRLGHTEG